MEHRDKIRLPYVLGPEFDGYSAAAMWDDARIGMAHLFTWERIAVVTDNDAYRGLVKGVGFLMPGQVRLFAVAELDDAKAWVAEAD